MELAITFFFAAHGLLFCRCVAGAETLIRFQQDHGTAGKGSDPLIQIAMYPFGKARLLEFRDQNELRVHFGGAEYDLIDSFAEPQLEAGVGQTLCVGG